jgi:hypothetical protein
MAAYRVLIGSTELSLPLETAVIGWDAVLDWKPDADSEAYIYGPKSEMTLYCSDFPAGWVGEGTKAGLFDTLLDESINCVPFQVQVQQMCAGEYGTVWEGTFSSKDWKVDIDLKSFTFRPTRRIGADCIRDGWNDQHNLFDLDPVEVKPYLAQYQIIDELVASVPTEDPCSDYWPVMAEYCEENTVEILPTYNAPTKFCHFTWGRYVLSGSCTGATPVEPDNWNTWTLLDDDCPTGSVWWTCPDTLNTVVFRFRNGRRLSDVLEFLVAQTGCGYEVQSDFFNINPPADAPENVAYDAALEALQDLIVFQKSDIKRHSASDVSRPEAWGMKLRELLADLAAMFNVRWLADEVSEVFRIEHVSFFEKQEGNDYTAELYEKALEPDKTNIVRVEKFRWRDERATPYFLGTPIHIDCGEGEKDTGATLFSTDIGFIISHDGLEAIGDDGFALMSTIEDTGLRMHRNNHALSFTELHDNFFRHDMPGSGQINGEDAVPLSLRKTRRQPVMTVPHCCDDDFDATKYHTTSLGDGDVLTASWNIAQDTLEIQLIY